MRKIGFVGSYDKTDMMLYIAKIMTELGQKVLLIDSTLMQKARYTVSNISPASKYITSYESIHVAIGFDNLEEIQKYVLMENSEELEYDFLLIDIDRNFAFESFGIEKDEKLYFVTSFDAYSLRRGLEAVAGLDISRMMTKVLYSKNMLQEEDEYLNYLSMPYKVLWSDEKILFPLENGDENAIYENQRMQKLKFKNLSTQYVDNISFMVESILGCNSGDVKKAIKKIERT